MSSDPRPPAQIAEAINNKASAVKNAALALNERIHQFEEYLGKLGGRVETDYYGWHPDSEEPWISLAIKLHRVGKDWILSYGTHDDRTAAQHPDYAVDYKPLTEASLRVKMAAIKQFPHVLLAVEKSQDKLIAEIDEVVAQFDIFAETLKPKEVSVAEQLRRAVRAAAAKGGR